MIITLFVQITVQWILSNNTVTTFYQLAIPWLLHILQISTQWQYNSWNSAAARLFSCTSPIKSFWPPLWKLHVRQVIKIFKNWSALYFLRFRKDRSQERFTENLCKTLTKNWIMLCYIISQTIPWMFDFVAKYGVKGLFSSKEIRVRQWKTGLRCESTTKTWCSGICCSSSHL